jgi:hypothetical protein
MYARKIQRDDGRYDIRFCWNHCELLLLTGRQHLVFAKLTELWVAENGSDSLLEPGALDAIFDLAARSWWDAGLDWLPRRANNAPESGSVV